MAGVTELLCRAAIGAPIHLPPQARILQPSNSTSALGILASHTV